MIRERRTVERITMGMVTAALGAFLTSCAVTDKPEPRSFYAPTSPPLKQELRWSNGTLPKTLDPAKAATPPEMDVVRALYEGLTEVDPKTLQAVPAVAEKWEASQDGLVYTFTLRDDAKWSNGDRVTALDFVRSWRRLVQTNANFPNARLISVVEGAVPHGGAGEKSADVADLFDESAKGTLSPADQEAESPQDASPGTDDLAGFGVSAPDDSTLVVRLSHPVDDFASLVSHPVFRPVHATEGQEVVAAKITNGPFVLGEVSKESIALERSPSYRAQDSVSLERIVFVSYPTAEEALAAYRNGEVDAVTNAGLEPLALKLLSPYDDFESATHAALNFYEFNLNKAPFNDRRVREALALAVERDRITEIELQGAAKPALNFLPFESEKEAPAFSEDRDRARVLLAEAGFKDGAGFPKIRLVVNRNDTQQRVARSVAKMWKQNLDVEVEVVIKESAEMQAVRDSGDFDILRRGVVIQTASRLIALEAMFEWTPAVAEAEHAQAKPAEGQPDVAPSSKIQTMDGRHLSERELLEEKVAIPLYFPISYSLVKPYISGFSLSMFDAVRLQSVKIDTSWKPSESGS